APGHEENEVWGITTLDHVESFPEKDLPAQHKFPEQCGEVFAYVAQCAPCLEWEWVTINVYSVETLIRFCVALHLGTDHRNLGAIFFQCVGFLPHAAVERQWQILYNYQNVFSCKHSLHFTS